MSTRTADPPSIQFSRTIAYPAREFIHPGISSAEDRQLGEARVPALARGGGRQDVPEHVEEMTDQQDLDEDRRGREIGVVGEAGHHLRVESAGVEAEEGGGIVVDVEREAVERDPAADRDADRAD